MLYGAFSWSEGYKHDKCQMCKSWSRGTKRQLEQCHLDTERGFAFALNVSPLSNNAVEPGMRVVCVDFVTTVTKDVKPLIPLISIALPARCKYISSGLANRRLDNMTWCIRCQSEIK